MESIFDLFQKITSLHKELEDLKPLKKEDDERLWKKFRLEWNFNSNHIEGNTLTYGQTELLLFFEKTTGDHDAREIDEMRGHDVALKMIVEYAKDKSREITEADIRELNKIILVRPFWSNAQTLDGQPTKKLIQPGEYKREPNSVLLQSGEMFHYASPEETPVRMKELMDWYRQAQAEGKSHPVELAAKLHYDFVRIHPFDDSNGRTSRLLMNYVLLRHDYPPLIIKSSDKRGYLNALNKADVGDKAAFTKYIADQMIWSLELSIKAAKGESIEERDDIDKEIEVWKKNKKIEQSDKSPLAVANIFKGGIIDLLKAHSERIERNFSDVFEKSFIEILHSEFGSRSHRSLITTLEIEKFINENYLKIFDQETKNISPIDALNFSNSSDSFIFSHRLENYLLPNGNKLNLSWAVRIELNRSNYSLEIDGVSITHDYNRFLSPVEIEDIIALSIKRLFDHIKTQEIKNLRQG